VIAYHATHDLMKCLRSVRQTTRDHDIVLGVCDNTERNDTNTQIAQAMGANLCHRGKNLGCAAGRNRIWRWMTNKIPDMRYLVIMDQDVVCLKGWLDDMLELMEARRNAGIIAWPCANMGDRPVREDGCISKAASVCNLHLVEAIEAVGGWDETFFMYRFDSLFADRTNNAGYRTYVQMKYYRPGVAWKKQTGGIIHDHPHQGIKRNPRWQKLREESDSYYRRVMSEEGWVEFDPMSEAPHLWSLTPDESLTGA
jgi:GT2 family glycosyltransferase